MEIKFDAYLFNNKETPTVFKEIGLKFYLDDTEFWKPVHIDGITLKKIDLPPKTLVSINIKCLIQNKDIMNAIEQGAELYFQAFFPNDKLYKKKILYINMPNHEGSTS
jgi:hypothetical protein